MLLYFVVTVGRVVEMMGSLIEMEKKTFCFHLEK